MNDNVTIQDSHVPWSMRRPRGRGRRVFWVIDLIGLTVMVTAYVPGSTGHPRHQRGFVIGDNLQRNHQRTEWALTQLNATQEQRQQVQVILQSLELDAVRWQEERQALNDRLVQAFAATEVKPKELAAIKSAGVALADQALSRTVAVVLTVSEVLTPDQRQDLVARWQAHP